MCTFISQSQFVVHLIVGLRWHMALCANWIDPVRRFVVTRVRTADNTLSETARRVEPLQIQIRFVCRIFSFTFPSRTFFAIVCGRPTWRLAEPFFMSDSIISTALLGARSDVQTMSNTSPGIIGLFVQGLEAGLVFAQLSSWLSGPDRTDSLPVVILTVFVTTVGLWASRVSL